MIAHLANPPFGRQALVLRGSKCLGSSDPHKSFIIHCVFLLKLLKQAPFCGHLLAGQVWLLPAWEDQTWSHPHTSDEDPPCPFYSRYLATCHSKIKSAVGWFVFFFFNIYQGLKPAFGALPHRTTFTRQQQRFNSFLPEGLAHFPARSLLFPIT